MSVTPQDRCARRYFHRVFHSTIIRSDHSTSETKIAGLPNFAPHCFKSVSVTPRAREQAPQAKIGMCFATTFSRVSLNGGQPTGRIAFAIDFRSKEVASASRKICTSWLASASTSPCAKGNAALVGSSGPHALFIMIFRDLFDSCAFVPNARKGRPASWVKNVRRAIIFLSRIEISTGADAAVYSSFSQSPRLQSRK